MTREDAVRIVGPAADDRVLLEIIGTGATKAELEEAMSWLYADDAMTRAGRHQPHGVIGELCRILSRPEVEIERE